MPNGPLYAMGGAHPHALGSAPGARDDAMRGLATGNREGKSSQREQEIYTPWEIVDVCLATWPDGIALDPCSGPGSIIPATEAWRGTRVNTGRRSKAGDTIYAWQGPGLMTPWVQHTYVNMPFEQLEEWLFKSARDHAAGVTEQILLFPVRPNRAWWCEYMSTIVSSVGWLSPLRFQGYESGFPAPLVLVHTGAPGAETGLRFREAVSGLSTFVGGPLS